LSGLGARDHILGKKLCRNPASEGLDQRLNKLDRQCLCRTKPWQSGAILGVHFVVGEDHQYFRKGNTFMLEP
jgi:hypothetical protein